MNTSNLTMNTNNLANALKRIELELFIVKILFEMFLYITLRYTVGKKFVLT